MTETSYLPLLSLTRGDLVESIHYGAIAVANPQGELVAWYANPQVETYLRSSAKPFQAMPFVEHGGQTFYNLSLKEIALVCASHSGTDEHVSVVQGIQAKTGVQESDLLCGTHLPGHKPTRDAMLQRGETPTPNRHNCSGKHTGMVAFARMRKLPYSLSDQPYIDPRHPIQAEILGVFSELCSLPTDQVHVGIDGCSAPNFAVPLHNAAVGYARLSDPGGLPTPRAQACRTIFTAMTTHPDMVGGPDSFDTRLMQATLGKIVCKGGAEGYQAMGIQPGALGPGSPAVGIAFKVSDGDAADRARPAVALEVLRQLGAITADELKTLENYGPSFTIRNYRHLVAGQAYPTFTLNREV